MTLACKSVLALGLLALATGGCDGDPIDIHGTGGSLGSGGRSGSGGAGGGPQDTSSAGQPAQAGGGLGSGGRAGEGGISASGGSRPTVPASGGCCNALYCPSGDTMVTACPAGGSCYQFTACGCYQVLCARPATGSGGAGGTTQDAGIDPDASLGLDAESWVCTSGGPCVNVGDVCYMPWYTYAYLPGYITCTCRVSSGSDQPTWLCPL
jgi:hypothetical protein